MPPDERLALTGTVGEGHVFTTVSAQRGEVMAIDLKPIFISLGLPRSAFSADVQDARRGNIFDATVGGGTTFPGVVWIFMGEDYIRLNLRTNELNRPQTIAPIGVVGDGHRHSPSGVHAAVSFTNEPTLVWFFKGSQYVRYNFVLRRRRGRSGRYCAKLAGLARLVQLWSGCRDPGPRSTVRRNGMAVQRLGVHPL